MIRNQLRNLDDYPSQTGNNIYKLNAHVQTLIDNLTSRGETTHDLLTNIFRAYVSFLYKNFIKYVADNQSWWDYGKDISPNFLIKKDSKTYRILKTNYIWEDKPAEKEK